MVDSELYEDALSKIDLRSRSNTFSIYQDAQSKINNYSKKSFTKKSESSVYQDAQSHITNNSGIHTHKNSFSKISQGKNEIEENKKDFLNLNNLNNIYKVDNIENNKKEKLRNRNKSFQNNEINNDLNGFEEGKSEGLYEEPKGEEIGGNEKKATIFEGVTQKGGECCNLPKCFIF